jgi:hypothetical protein
VVSNPNADADEVWGTSQTDIISLFLPRTCREIYNETNQLFWTSNTFTFREPKDLLWVFKGMGHMPSRCITSIHLPLGAIGGNFLEILLKALDLLAKKESMSSLQRLDLVLDVFHIQRISNLKISIPTNIMGHTMEFRTHFLGDFMMI